MNRGALEGVNERQERLWKIIGGIDFGGGSGNLWTPSLLPNLALWLDATDAATIILNGSNVAQWNDKSGTGRNVAQAIAAQQPAYNTTAINGRAGLVFDGINDIIDNQSAALLRNVSGSTLIAVSRRAANLANQATAFFVDGVGGTRAALFYRTAGTGTDGISAAGRRLNADAFQALGGNAYNSDFQINIGRFDYQGADLRLFENGTQTGQRVFQTSGNTSNDGGALNIGSNTAFTIPLNGAIGDIIICEQALSTDNRQRVEGFLAHKYWGAGSLNPLPIDHPFKFFAPRI